MTSNMNISLENSTDHDHMSLYENIAQEIADVLQKIVQNAGELIDVQQCSIALLDMHGSALVTMAALGDQKLRRSRFQLNEGVAGWVAAHRKPLMINDVELDARFKRLGRSPIGSMICVPLIDADRFIGTITASSALIDGFDSNKVRLLTVFAEQAVLAITNARYAKQADRYASQLELLLDLSHGMTARMDAADLYRTVLMDMRQLVPCTLARMYRYREATQDLLPVAELSDLHDRQAATVRAVQDAQEQRIRLADNDSLLAWAAVQRHPMLLTPSGESLAEAQIAAPLISKNALYGVLLLKRGEAFGSEELRLVRHVSNIAATALENADLLQGERADREQLQTILASITEGIALFDAKGLCLEANGPFSSIFGIEEGRVPGMDYREIFGEVGESMRVVQQSLQQGQALPYTEVDIEVQEVARSLGISITPVAMARGILSLIVVRDVTAIRDATRMKANFLSMITHELRSPLNAINGYLDLALEGVAGELDPQLREFLQRSRAGSEHLYALVEDLLLVSRADAGQLRLHHQIIDLQQIVRNTTEELELTARDRAIEVAVMFPAAFPRLYADPVRLQQVLRNLLTNALRFTEAGGRVTISAEVESVVGEQDDEPLKVVKLHVQDTGAGIALEQQQRIFERFYQIPRPGSRLSGQGLGLAIVKMIVELHRGTVMVTSTLGQGSTFTCTLPCVLS